MGDVDLTARAGVHAALADRHRLAIVDALALGDRTPGELGELTAIPSNLLAHHLRILEAAGVTERRASKGEAGRRYVVLRPERIGVELSEELQLHPEQSTDAMIVHHPEAKYFNAR